MKIRNSLALISVFTLASLTTLPCYADYSFPYNGEWWLNAGLGASTGKNTDVPLPANISSDIFHYEKSEAQDVGGPAGEISLNFATTNNQLLTLRYFESSHLISGPGDGQLTEGAVLYGLMSKSSSGYISGSAGLSVVNAGYSGGTDELGVTFDHVTQTTVGLPLEVQAFLTPFKYIGFGVVGLADINSHAPVAAGLLELQVGNLTP